MGSSKKHGIPSLDNVKSIFRIAESNLDALNTVDLGPKRPFSVGECALWARFAGPRFAEQVPEVASLVDAPSCCCKAAAMPKEAMAIKYIKKISNSIKKFLEPPFAGKHPKQPFAGSDSRRSHSRGRLRGDKSSGC